MTQISEMAQSLISDVQSVDALLSSLAMKVLLIYGKKANPTLESMVAVSRHLKDIEARIEAMEIVDG